MKFELIEFHKRLGHPHGHGGGCAGANPVCPRWVSYLVSLRPVTRFVLLVLPQSLSVPFHLFPQNGVFSHRRFLVKFQTSDPFQTFQIDVAPPSHAYSVHDKRGFDVNLEQNVRMEENSSRS